MQTYGPSAVYERTGIFILEIHDDGAAGIDISPLFPLFFAGMRPSSLPERRQSYSRAVNPAPFRSMRPNLPPSGTIYTPQLYSTESPFAVYDDMAFRVGHPVLSAPADQEATLPVAAISGFTMHTAVRPYDRTAVFFQETHCHSLKSCSLAGIPERFHQRSQRKLP